MVQYKEQGNYVSSLGQLIMEDSNIKEWVAEFNSWEAESKG